MAKQIGLVRYSGTIGNVRHYKLKGRSEDFAGLAGGVERERILKDPAFKRTRENMNEFGGAAKMGKALRNALSSVVSSMADPTFAGRLTGVLKKVNAKGSGVRGQREIPVTGNTGLIEGLEMNRALGLGTVLRTSSAVTSTAARNEATLSVDPFNPANHLLLPAGATHFQIILAIASLSDYAYDTVRGYAPKAPTLNGIEAVARTTQLDVNTPLTAVTTLNAQLPGSPTMTADASLVTCVGIEFYQEVQGSYYLFAQNNAMQFTEVF